MASPWWQYVGGAGIEPAASTVWRWHSTAELTAHYSRERYRSLSISHLCFRYLIAHFERKPFSVRFWELGGRKLSILIEAARDLSKTLVWTLILFSSKRDFFGCFDFRVSSQQRNFMDDARCTNDFICRIALEIEIMKGLADWQGDRPNMDSRQDSG